MGRESFCCCGHCCVDVADNTNHTHLFICFVLGATPSTSQGLGSVLRSHSWQGLSPRCYCSALHAHRILKGKPLQNNLLGFWVAFTCECPGERNEVPGRCLLRAAQQKPGEPRNNMWVTADKGCKAYHNHTGNRGDGSSLVPGSWGAEGGLQRGTQDPCRALSLDHIIVHGDGEKAQHKSAKQMHTPIE